MREIERVESEEDWMGMCVCVPYLLSLDDIWEPKKAGGSKGEGEDAAGAARLSLPEEWARAHARTSRQPPFLHLHTHTHIVYGVV